MRRWLARDDLNKFSPADRRVELSKIFDWYGSDFQKADGGLRAALGKDFPIIGVGGILSGHDAITKIEAGADVVQIYTGLIYKGPALVTEVASALQQMKR